MARPSKYSEELVNEICRRIADGGSLRAICREEGMPERETIYCWLKNKPEFSDQYARAKDNQAESLFEEIDEISRRPMKNMVEVNRARLQIDALKWRVGKLAPKKYGEYKQVDANVTSIKRPDQMTDEELRIFLGSDASSDNTE